MESLNEKIRRIRKDKGISQVEVAKASGINQASYSNIEKGDTKSISIEVGKGIAKALKISFNELFDIETPENEVNFHEEIAKLNKRIEELEEQLEDKKKRLISYKDTFDYFTLFSKFSSELLFIENGEETEILDMSAMELFQEVEGMIKRERGEIYYTLSENGFGVKFPSTEEMKLMKFALNEMKKAKDTTEFNPNI